MLKKQWIVRKNKWG